MFAARDTIFARSSGAGRAGVTVFRISGPKAGTVLDDFCGGRGTPRHARFVRVRLADGSLLDEGLALWFPGPSSFTGEDVAELHLHGSPAVERAFGNAMLEQGLTPASAGAFTLRAFEAGKLDLSQAEGLGDLLTAETEMQRRQALGQLGGRLSDKAEGWRDSILNALAAFEAAVDFPDEEDIPRSVAEQARGPLQSLLAEMTDTLATASGARRIREGVRVALVGPPNAGKSSLLNRLVGDDRAIVSPEAGTTRDLLEVQLDIGGVPVTLIDTAGVREAEGAIEREGVARAETAARTADIRVEVRDLRTVDAPALVSDTTVWVANKCDSTQPSYQLPPGWLPISALTGEGISEFLALLGDLTKAGTAGILTRDRHVALVEQASIRISRMLEGSAPPEIATEELRGTLRDLEELTGRITPDDVLGEVFSAFCVGK